MDCHLSKSCHSDNNICKCTKNASICSQSLDEMDFERGIWSAAMHGEEKEVQKYLDRKISPDIQDSAGYTALHYASRHGHTTVCKLLLNSGANPNISTRAGKASVLHRAALFGHVDIVKLLIQYGAQLDIEDSDQQTPLHKASQKRHGEVINLLIKHNPSLLSIKDKWGKLPVDYIGSENQVLQTSMNLAIIK